MACEHFKSLGTILKILILRFCITTQKIIKISKKLQLKAKNLSLMVSQVKIGELLLDTLKSVF